MTLEETCRRIVARFTTVGINFLAVDFDATFISIHTGGRWPGNETDLAPHIRPLFRTLVPMCIDFGISVAIVTFSGQIDLIRRLLIRELPPGIGEKIAIRGRDSSWAWAGTRGKQAFMASAAQELSETMAITITDKSTVLVDDDVNNIAIAIENGIPAVAYDVRNELRTIQALETLAV